MVVQEHPNTLTDTTLIERVVARDRDAFLALYDRFSPRLLGIIVSVLHDREAAEDVLQDVMLEVWNRHAARYNAVLGPVDCWLLRLARSRAIDLSRRRARRAAAPIEEASAFAEDLGTALESDEGERLQTALRDLDEEERVPVLLAYARGLSREEIAAQLGIPVGTVKTRIRRGIENLRQALTASASGAEHP